MLEFWERKAKFTKAEKGFLDILKPQKLGQTIVQCAQFVSSCSDVVETADLKEIMSMNPTKHYTWPLG